MACSISTSSRRPNVWGKPWNAPQGDLGIAVGQGEDASLTGDLLEMYFNQGTDTLVVRRDSVTSNWGVPVVVSELGQATTPKVSPDGLELLLASNRAGGMGSLDIMMTSRLSRTDAWASPTHVIGLSSPSSESSASMSADRLRAVMTRGGSSSSNIWSSRRASPEDPWEAPTLEPGPSSPVRDGSAFVTADGLSLFFSSTRDRGGGTVDADIYYSHRESIDEPFPAALSIPELSSVLNEDDPWVSPDGHHIYFVRGTGADGTPQPTSLLLHAVR
jgi:hypothetical protein